MPRITKISPQKNKKRVNVYLDGKFAFGLPTETLVEVGLAVGQELSEKETEALIFKNEFQKLLDRAYHFLSFRPRSEKEIKDFLKKKGVTEKISEKIIKKLKKLGYLNDLEFTSWWIEQRNLFRPRGKIALKMELRQKGVDQEIASQVIEKKVDELPLAKKAAQRKMKAYKNLPPREFYQKMAAFLSRRGFSWSTIKMALEEIIKK
ncbi:MAG TPA: RecX family transcriptional regulator [Nevskiaceae bacterium]|nr:RecX family transcriptional regulator [Nevskiaceae bacterium]